MTCAVLAVPHSGLSEGMRGLLATVFDSVMLVADEPSLTACLDGVRPDLLVLDIGLVPGGSLRLTARLKSAHSRLRILLVSDEDDPRLVGAAAAAGADGFLLTASLGDDLLGAAERVLGGGKAFWTNTQADRGGQPLSPGDV